MMDVPLRGAGAATYGGQSLPCKGGVADGTQAAGESPAVPVAIGFGDTYHANFGPESLLTARRHPSGQ